MRAQKRVTITVVGVLAGLLLWGGWQARGGGGPSQKRVRPGEVPLGQGLPWYGGKPGVPVRVASDLDGEVPADEWVPVRVSVWVETSCSTVQVRLRGVDGLQVVSDEPAGELDQACPKGMNPVIHSARIRVPEGVEGLLAVDVRVHSEEGVRGAVRALAFRDAMRKEITGDPSEWGQTDSD